MKRLTKKGWNNVIILVVLVMIVVLRLSDERLTGTDPVPVTDGLLPTGAVVLTWAAPAWRIERLGQSWRAVPDLGLDGAGLEAVLNQWLSWQLPPAEMAVRGASQPLTVWLAGVAEPVSLQLYQDQGQYAVVNWRGQLLSLSQAQYRSLLSGGH
ncbi:hypothetical protein [Pseudaeromonas paramecii]|uniref:DUF4340 domain-containing protein n=1 Tax=Pseudaeromonas paramecii TaxID=2138166 RepID=A0ABP8PZB4_9GAMM